MTIENPVEDEVKQLARRVERARGRLAYQFDPALNDALSEDELLAERDLAEKIRDQDRGQRWKQVQAAASAADRARQTTEEIEKADIRDLLVARKAIAAQRRESSPHAKLASLYRHRAWSLRALAGVVAAGMLWSAVNVQHNIAPGGPGDPLYWFSYLIEAMISVCLVIIMIGTNKVAEWGVLDSRRQVVIAEIALLTLTISLNTYPYIHQQHWYEAVVHAVAPMMIGVALLIHDAASARYGLAIFRATDQIRELPDPADLIRRRMPTTIATYRANMPPDLAALAAAPTPPPSAEPQQPVEDTETVEVSSVDGVEYAEEEVAPSSVAVEVGAPIRRNKTDRSNHETREAPNTVGIQTVTIDEPIVAMSVKSKPSIPVEKLRAPAIPAGSRQSAAAEAKNGSTPVNARNGSTTATARAIKETPMVAEPELDVVRTPEIYDTGQFRIADLEAELAELQAARRRARAGKQR